MKMRTKIEAINIKCVIITKIWKWKWQVVIDYDGIFTTLSVKMMENVKVWCNLWYKYICWWHYTDQTAETCVHDPNELRNTQILHSYGLILQKDWETEGISNRTEKMKWRQTKRDKKSLQYSIQFIFILKLSIFRLIITITSLYKTK